MGSTKYTIGVDMWAVGCVLGEMTNMKPVFPGTSTMNQIERIVQLTGPPVPDDIEAIASPFAGTMLQTLPATTSLSLHEVFPGATAECRDFLKSLLQFNPNQRPTAEAALRHVFVGEFHNEEEEPIYPGGPLILPIDDNTKLTAVQYRERLYQEIANRRKDSTTKKAASKNKPGAPLSGPV